MANIGDLRFRWDLIDIRVPETSLFGDPEYWASERNALRNHLLLNSQRLVYEQKCDPPSERKHDLIGTNTLVVQPEVIFFVTKVDAGVHQFDENRTGIVRRRTHQLSGLTPEQWTSEIRKKFGSFGAQAPIDRFKAFFGPNKSFNIYFNLECGYFRMISNRFGRREWAILALPVGGHFTATLIKDCQKEELEWEDRSNLPASEEVTFTGGSKESVKLMIKEVKDRISDEKHKIYTRKRHFKWVMERRLDRMEDGQEAEEISDIMRRRHKERIETSKERIRELNARLKDLRAKLGDLVEDDP